MNRREFMQLTAVACAGAVARRDPLAAQTRESGWRTFEVTTRVEVVEPSGSTRVWVPAALINSTVYQRTLGNVFTAPGGTARLVEFGPDALGIIVAEFPSGVSPVVTVRSRVATRSHAVNLSAPERVDTSDTASLAHFLRPTKLLPTDGIVRVVADDITRGAKSDVDKARAIYDWIVNNTARDPATRGCGIGDIRFMLQSRSLGGKCADLNALYVGLARAAGLPARDVYGIRVAASKLGYRSLGTSPPTVTGAQHCRAEVHLKGFGWVPVDPADVRKVILEEPPGNRDIADPMVRNARTRLFGSWEMNWMAYNYAHDVVLPGSSGAPIGFLMYPQAETAKGRRDSLDPEQFQYDITSREILPPAARR